jgi:hypothetical protein
VTYALDLIEKQQYRTHGNRWYEGKRKEMIREELRDAYAKVWSVNDTFRMRNDRLLSKPIP